MPESKFKKSTDSEEEIRLDSALIYASWRQGVAYAGCKAEFELGTVFVGDGAKIEVTGKSEKGKKLGSVKGAIHNNVFIGAFDIPEDMEPPDEVFYEVKLSKNGIDEESDRIPARVAPVVKNLRWSSEVVRRGEAVTMTASVEKVPHGTEAIVTIYEYDSDGAHEKITELPTTVEKKRIEVIWDYEYFNRTTHIPTEGEFQKHDDERHYAYPEYFFTLTFGGVEYGREQESDLLRFLDWISIKPLDDSGEPFPEAEYILYLADGTQREGKLDEYGEAVEEDLPPGQVSIALPKEGYLWGRR